MINTTHTLMLEPVDIVDNISQEQFQVGYFQPLKPLVIKKLTEDWPAQTKWTPDFFRKYHGAKNVTVYDKNFVTPGKGYMGGSKQMKLGDYVEQVLTTRQDLRMFLYNIKSQIPELLSDIRLPNIANGFSKQFIFMFFGCQDSITQMHFDIDMSHVFHTVLYGKKTVTLFPYEQSINLHRTPFTCRSYVDVDSPDFNKFPGLLKARGHRVTLEPGDTLFIPSGWWHHMVYDEAGYALSLRCSNPALSGKLHGLYNLLIMQTLDRVMNFTTPKFWHEWKQRRAAQAVK